MNIKIYTKKGARNYKENRLLKKLTDVIQKKASENPNFLNDFKPANDWTELNNLYNKYCTEEAEYVDVTNDTTEQPIETQPEKPKDMPTEEVIDNTLNEDSVFIDPLNREEPKVRSYVMEEEFQTPQQTEAPKRTQFAEPLSFEESFEIPDDSNDKKATETKGGQQTKKPQPTAPVNPNYQDMEANKKRKNSRKFAKYIVEAICMLSEKGFVWYATKDINEAKLAEYELNDEMDLDLLVTLSEGQEVTVKEFFKGQCVQAEMLSKFDDQKKQDLADALAEVMMEKGVAPTPMQELMLVALTVIGEKAVALITITSQNNSLLNQLRTMHEGRPQRKNFAPPPPPTPPPPTQTTNKVQDIQFTETEREVVKEKLNETIEAIEGQYEEIGDVIEKPLETKE